MSEGVFLSLPKDTYGKLVGVTAAISLERLKLHTLQDIIREAIREYLERYDENGKNNEN